METYLSFDEYTEMGGTITDESLFNSLAIDANALIDWYTFNRLWNETEIPERVKICEFQLIKLLGIKNNILTPDVSTTGGVNTTAQIMAQSNDGVSVEYSVLHADVMYDKADAEIANCIKRYLNGVLNSAGRKLLYRGLYPDE